MATKQCIFVGTTNKEAYLRDETGGRRFWPVKVGTIDTDAMRRDRDQLFAEAVAAYRSGTGWWPSASFEIEHIAAEQEARFESNAWEEPVSEYLRGRGSVTVLGVAQQGLKIVAARLATTDQRRITMILKRLGWSRGERTSSTRPWVAPQSRNDA